MAKGDASAIAHDDAFVDEIVVDGLSISHASKEEVGISRIHLFAYRQVAEGFDHASALL